MKDITKHIGYIVGVSVLLVIIALYSIKIYTKHNAELIMVPLLEGKSSLEAIEELEALGLRAEIVDTVYKDGAKKLEVINQNPPCSLEVKPNRRVYLVINSDEVPMVEIPDLVGKTSLGQAKNILSRQGLRLGKVIERPCDYVRSRSDEPVIGQYMAGDSVNLKVGGLVERNSVIDLVICVPLQQQDSTTSTPDLEPEDVIELFN